MQKVKDNWPTVAAFVAMVVLFILKNRSVLTVEDLNYILGAVGIGGIFGAQRMQPPGAPAEPEPRTHITIPPQG